MEQELLTLPEHLSSPSVFSGVRVARSLVFSVVFCRPLLVFLTIFRLDIALPVHLRFTVSDYPFWYLETFLGYSLVSVCITLLSPSECLDIIAQSRGYSHDIVHDIDQHIYLNFYTVV